jgi:hypothetical protein
MSIHNTKRTLYHIWHSNTEDSPLGMMMDRNEEEGAHITVPPPLGSCATKSKANGFTFFVKNDQRRSTEEASVRMPAWHLTVLWFIAKGVRHRAIHPRMRLMTKSARCHYSEKVGSRSTVWLSATILPLSSTNNESHGTNAVII